MFEEWKNDLYIHAQLLKLQLKIQQLKSFIFKAKTLQQNVKLWNRAVIEAAFKGAGGSEFNPPGQESFGCSFHKIVWLTQVCAVYA